MKPPKDLKEFKEIIHAMEHRERVLFQTNDGLMLEVYFTIVVNIKNMFDVRKNNNVNFKLYKDYNGKTEKIVFSKSTYLKLLQDSFLQTIFDNINQKPKKIKI
jgi:hypothetical protein